MKQYEQKYNDVLNDLGKINMVWYKSILEYYKNNEDHNWAIKLMQSFIDKNKIADLMQEVATIKYGLMTEFSNNEKYMKWYSANF